MIMSESVSDTSKRMIILLKQQETDSYRVLLSDGEGEYEEKKSRFIAHVRKCTTEEEAAAFIEEMKKKYWDARHNCSAFVIGKRGELTRCSDDGEPSGTAGRPMLEVLIGSGIRDVAVVVTRYFGGVLLGTGGLVRAYTQAVKEGLMACQTGRMGPGVELLLATDYNGVGKILYLLGQRGLEPLESNYGERVELKVLLPAKQEEAFTREVTEATAGRTMITKKGAYDYVQKED